MSSYYRCASSSTFITRAVSIPTSQDQTTIGRSRCDQCHAPFDHPPLSIPIVHHVATNTLLCVGSYCTWRCIQICLHTSRIPLYRKAISQTGFIKKTIFKDQNNIQDFEKRLKNFFDVVIIRLQWSYEKDWRIFHLSTPGHTKALESSFPPPPPPLFNILIKQIQFTFP